MLHGDYVVFGYEIRHHLHELVGGVNGDGFQSLLPPFAPCCVQIVQKLARQLVLALLQALLLDFNRRPGSFRREGHHAPRQQFGLGLCRQRNVVVDLDSHFFLPLARRCTE